ncbi:hypothetical protein Dda_6780 [Drechslerella dactyloides]|uniref:Uncharacterized protein n=1 Tax=Drechslerella dactyloides TaxID=74499 RepID=A0AAD6NHQ4_DREDA|nr:hypothetical protein Dda_6780 [Drechslerella dactyloides]
MTVRSTRQELPIRGYRREKGLASRDIVSRSEISPKLFLHVRLANANQLRNHGIYAIVVSEDVLDT